MNYLFVAAVLLQLTPGVTSKSSISSVPQEPAAQVEASAIVLPNMTLQGTTVETFTEIVMQAGMSGGIVRVLDGCNRGSQKPLQISEGTTLKQALDAVAANETSTGWQVRDGVINMLPAGASIPPLLQVRIRNFRWDKTASVRETISRLRNAKEVTTKARQLGLREANFEGSASAICIRNCSTSPKNQPDLVMEPESTLLTLLNHVIQSHDRSVWSYSENHCGSENVFMLERIAE